MGVPLKIKISFSKIPRAFAICNIQYRHWSWASSNCREVVLNAPWRRCCLSSYNRTLRAAMEYPIPTSDATLPDVPNYCTTTTVLHQVLSLLCYKNYILLLNTYIYQRNTAPPHHRGGQTHTRARVYFREAQKKNGSFW